MDLTVVSYNVRGINNKFKREKLYDRISAVKADIIGLQETHSKEELEEEISKEWKGEAYLSHGPDTLTSGVAILIRDSSNITVIDEDKSSKGRYIILTIRSGEEICQICNIYAPTLPQKRPKFYRKIADKIDPDIPLILMGDFNMVMNTDEDRIGTKIRTTHTSGKRELQQIITRHTITDAWRYKHPKKKEYTYRTGNKQIQSRLDRIYVPDQYHIKYATIIPLNLSDHDAVICTISTVKEKRQNTHWKLNSTILNLEETKEKIKEICEEFIKYVGRYDKKEKWWEFFKKITTGELQRISKKNARRIRKEYNDKLEKLIRMKNDATVNDEDLEDAENDFERCLLYRYEGARIRAKTTIQIDEEKPTKFFYSMEKKQQKHSNIHTINDETGIPQNHPKKIEEITGRYYENLYKRKKLNRQKQQEILQLLTNKIPDCNNLDCPIQEKEIKKAIRDMTPEKSPGCDGLTIEFYKNFEEEIVPLLKIYYNALLEEKATTTTTMKNAIITLIPKKDDPKELKNWRPISLLNNDYKILSRILAERLRTSMENIITDTQTCAVPGRTINQNLTFVRDLLIKTSKAKTSITLLSIDFEKAFDNVDRNYLFEILKKFGYPQKFINLLKTLYEDTTSQIKINGELTGKINIENGLRQGCPLSLPLFVIYAETLQKFIQNSKITGLRFKEREENIKCIQYADDTLILLNLNDSIDDAIKILTEYGEATGLKINKNKTKALHTGEIPPTTENKIQWANRRHPLNVLGIKFTTDYHATQYINWEEIMEKIENRRHELIMRNLSLKGRSMMINTLLTSKMTYISTILPMPKEQLKRFESIIFPLLWNHKKPEPIKRDTLYLPINEGGLGLINPLIHNRAMTVKNLLRAAENPTFFSSHQTLYWMRTPLSTIKKEWSHLKNWKGPQNFMSTPPEPYQIALHIIKKHPETHNENPSVRIIYKHLRKENQKDHQITGKEKWNLNQNKQTWNIMAKNAFLSYNDPLHKNLYFRFLHFSLPTKQHIASHTRGQLSNIDSSCPSCGATEDQNHAIIYCPRNAQLWKIALNNIKRITGNSSMTSTQAMTYQKLGNKENQKLYNTIITAILFATWTTRNFDLGSKLRKTAPHIVRNIYVNTVSNILRTFFQYYNDRNDVTTFQKIFCNDKELCSYNSDNKSIVTFVSVRHKSGVG